jgi:hypothetical protein
MKAVNILWDIDLEDGLYVLDEMTAKEASEVLGISEERYANMTSEERDDYACEVFERSPSTLVECIGLPDEVEIPKRLKNKDGERISDWLSDEFGFCHKGFELEE